MHGTQIFFYFTFILVMVMVICSPFNNMFTRSMKMQLTMSTSNACHVLAVTYLAESFF